MQSLTRAARYSVLPGMNDRVLVMRLCGVLLVAACSSDPSLDVSVHHPAGYAVTQTVVTVYFGDDISCSAIEYGDRTDAELAAIAADEVDVTSGGRVEVSRLGGKSLVARGYDAQHRFVTAGCKDAGEITAGTKLTIDTQPTAIVAIDPGQAELPFSQRTIVVNLSDSNGVPLDGNVSWLLTGPAGAPVQQPSAGVATKAGNARIHVDDLGTPGPEGLRIRVPWATAPLPLVTGFDVSHMTTLSLGGGNPTLGGHPSCDIRGHAGKLPTLVCLDQANAVGHRDVVEIAWQTDHYAVTPLPALPATINNQFALFVDHDGSADEPGPDTQYFLLLPEREPGLANHPGRSFGNLRLAHLGPPPRLPAHAPSHARLALRPHLPDVELCLPEIYAKRCGPDADLHTRMSIVSRYSKEMKNRDAGCQVPDTGVCMEDCLP